MALPDIGGGMPADYPEGGIVGSGSGGAKLSPLILWGGLAIVGFLLYRRFFRR